MRDILVRCLGLNLICIAVSVGLLFIYPRQQGFTVTTLNGTRFIQGGVFLGLVVTSISDVAIGLYVCYCLWRSVSFR